MSTKKRYASPTFQVSPAPNASPTISDHFFASQLNAPGSGSVPTLGS